MVALVAIGLVLSRVLNQTNTKVSKDHAVAIARHRIDFKPDGHNIRLQRRGIPPKPFWAVSFWTRKANGGYDRVTTVLVDASTGRIAEVRRVS